MTSTVETCKDLQGQEWQALQSIYPDFVPSGPPEYGEPAVLQIGVQLSEPTPVHIFEEHKSGIAHSVDVSHLPPLLLSFLLPPTYPLEQPPIIHSLRSSHGWLPPAVVKLLMHRLLGMWNNESVLGIWAAHIQNGEELLSSFDLLHLSPKSIQLSNPTPHTLMPALAAHNASVLEAHFRDSTHTCPICLDRLLGAHCIALSRCMHVACRSCLREFWTSCILEGDVARVSCPDPECVKELRQASIEDVMAIVNAEAVVRWQSLLQKQAIERDPTIVLCPLTSCQRPVACPPPAEDGRPSEWDRLRTCECGFAFCTYCRRGWHGPHTPCAVPITAEFVRLYMQHPEGSPERLAIEARHGKRNIMRVIAQFDEDQLNRKWMEEETRACPGCEVRVVSNAQKAMGCNHMTCSKCRQHFCYRCGDKINASDPYQHYNTQGLSCYYKLWEAN